MISYQKIKIYKDFNLEKISNFNKTKDKIIQQLKKCDFIDKVYEYGNSQYIPGISDLDLLIVINNKKIDFKAFKKLNQLIYHPPYIIHKNDKNTFIKNNLFLFNLDQNFANSNLEDLFNQSEKLKIKVDSYQLFLAIIENIFIRKIYIHSILLNKKIGYRIIFKTIKQYYTSIERLNKANLFTLTNKEKNNLKKIKTQIELIKSRIIQQKKIDYQIILNDFIFAENFSNNLINKAIVKIKLNSNRSNKKIQVKKTDWGNIIFIDSQNYFIKTFFKILSLFFNLMVFDKKFLNYLDQFEQKKIKEVQIKKRIDSIKKWKNFIKSKNLTNYTGLANIDIYFKIKN